MAGTKDYNIYAVDKDGKRIFVGEWKERANVLTDNFQAVEDILIALNASVSLAEWRIDEENLLAVPVVKHFEAQLANEEDEISFADLFTEKEDDGKKKRSSSWVTLEDLIFCVGNHEKVTMSIENFDSIMIAMDALSVDSELHGIDDVENIYILTIKLTPCDGTYYKEIEVIIDELLD